MKLTSEQIKEMADRAEARSKGSAPNGGNGTSDAAKAAIESIIDQDKIDAEIERLATLSMGEYYRERKTVAAKIGYPVGYLDKVVTSKRPETKTDSTEGFHLPHWDVAPWNSPIATADLLDEITTVFNRYVVLPEHAADALALWIAHAWAFDAWDEVSPFLVLMSPTKRCGKTTVLVLTSWLTPRSAVASNISLSAIFRFIDAAQPTLLIDEADTFLKENVEIRGMLNACHVKATAHTWRNVETNKQITNKRFSTWSPKVIAGIGRFADTLEDRAVLVRMQRKPKGARVERCRYRDMPEYAALRQKAMRWAADAVPALRAASVKSPDDIHDRAVQNWDPLLAIADMAGAEWAKKARAAASALTSKDEDDHDFGVEFLRDTRKAFASVADQDIFTRELSGHLNADPERPWATYSRGDKPITDRAIGKLAGRFGIVSTTIHRAGGIHAKGYSFADFEDAWARYTPPQTIGAPLDRPTHPCIRASADVPGTSDVFSSVRDPSTARIEKCEKPANDGDLHGCTDGKPDSGCANDSASAGTANCAHCGERDGRPLFPAGDVLVHRECLAQYRPEEEPQDEW
jgi:putative DNA primase/helicase